MRWLLTVPLHVAERSHASAMVTGLLGLEPTMANQVPPGMDETVRENVR